LQIRTQIFSWVFLATIVPLAVLALGATYYIEYDYQNDVEEAVANSLDTLGSTLKRQMEQQVQLVSGLSKSNAVQDFLPLLSDAEAGQVPAEFNVFRSRLNHYFEGFQTILQGQYVLRLMDRFGNSYIKVDQNKRSIPTYEGISGIFFVEQEVDGLKFNAMLEKLPANEVSMTNLPHNAQQSSLMEILPLLDYIIPLYHQEKLVGAITLTRFGDRIDAIFNHAPRLFEAKLFVAENNPDMGDRHGLLLFDDELEINLAKARHEYQYLFMELGETVFNRILDEPFGKLELADANETIYYKEFFPYPTQLTSWIIGLKISNEVIIEPFQQIRLVIWSITLISLVISLFLSDIGVRLIARPVRELATNLLSYARGEQLNRVNTNARIDEIRDLEIAFNTLADSLDKTSEERDRAQNMMLQSAKLASIGQMAAGIGHEINNPLNNILSYAKLIERDLKDSDDRARSDLKSLKEEAVRASDIIRGILNFARQVPPQYAPFHVEQWLQDTLNLVRQSAKTAGIELAYECSEDKVVEADRGQLQQALINLLINAIQASERDSQVKTVVSFTDTDLIVSVVDHGKGIDQESLDLIFDPFFTTKPEGEGSGLGLSVSLGIIERHNGKLMLKNNPDGGVTATMAIPLSKEKDTVNE
jgi:two-component system NtrC family sensor kinase